MPAAVSEGSDIQSEPKSTKFPVFSLMIREMMQRAVRIRLRHPPPSLRFEGFSVEVRKLRACSGDVHGPSAPENAQTVSRAASLRFFSPWASNSVPMPAVGEHNVRAGTTDIASDATGTSSFRRAKSVGQSIAF
jgi:hypothetical protein